MSQAPEDATAAASTDAKGTSAAEDAKKALKGFGNKLKELGQKAVDSTKKFVEETEDDIKNTKSMEGLLTMAGSEFQNYINTRSKTTDKVEVLKEIADSFKFSLLFYFAFDSSLFIYLFCFFD